MKPSVVRSFVAAVALAPLTASAQLVVPKTVPVHQNQQFEIFPSYRAGMGGVAIALDDTVLDPFVNPAKASRAPGGLIQIAPYVHSVTLGGGGGRTVPLSAYFSSARWSGAALFSLQQLDRPNQSFDAPLSERHATNQYLAASVARKFYDGLTLGASVYRSSLGAVDGVDRLYSGSDRIQEDGGQVDVRLGLLKEWGRGRSFEALVLHDRYRMTHDVHYPQRWGWSPCCGGNIGIPPRPDSVRTIPERNEHNVDRTEIWGLHTEYSQPVGERGWRVGWLATYNRLTHPKIPNYQIMNIPRDPGYTNAFNLGFGLARSTHGTTLGIDVVLEPMWSRTWATAAHDTMTAVDGKIPAGGRTVDNQFRFSNSLLRVGVAQDLPLTPDSSSTLVLQAGLGLYSIDYRLKQTNHVSFVSRTQDENWMEWTPSLGIQLRGRDVQVAYDFSLTCGPNCGGSGTGGIIINAPAPTADGGGVIVAPSSPLTFDGGSAKRHRVTFSFVLR